MSKEGSKQENESHSEKIVDVIRKQYQKNLSETARRGLKNRAERGWAPFVPPLGYLNDLTTKTIVPDPETWGRVHILLETAATKKLSIHSLVEFARDELAIKCKNGQQFNNGALRRMMSNPFYAGRFWYGGNLYDGRHQAMITEEQFNCLQDILKTETSSAKK